jgi:hypothetical protein
MNGKQMKKIRTWCQASFDATPVEERNGLTIDVYINRVKNFWKVTPDFQKFMTMSLKQHYLS